MSTFDSYKLTKEAISSNVNTAISGPIDEKYLAIVSQSLCDILPDLSDVQFQNFMYAMERNREKVAERIREYYV